MKAELLSFNPHRSRMSVQIARLGGISVALSIDPELDHALERSARLSGLSRAVLDRRLAARVLELAAPD